MTPIIELCLIEVVVFNTSSSEEKILTDILLVHNNFLKVQKGSEVMHFPNKLTGHSLLLI